MVRHKSLLKITGDRTHSNWLHTDLLHTACSTLPYVKFQGLTGRETGTGTEQWPRNHSNLILLSM